MVNYDSIKELGDFYSLLPRVEIDDKARRMYKRVFDRERDIKVINGTGWDLTEVWLIRNIYLPGKNPLEYLMKGYKAIEIQHRKNQAKLYDIWNEDRFKQFEVWVRNTVENILNKTIDNITQTTKIREDDLLRETYIIDISKINKSYTLFNKVLFDEMPFIEYLSCFNLDFPEPKHPNFKDNQGVKFVYFLSKIEDLKVNDKIALNRFGLKNYKTRKRTTNPEAVFINQVATILK